ncbi:MAG TPA: nicotinate (nicotinamide) nucleotide adenylyltransferase [Flavobacteriales bacterium]|nr:nicotinate (nicotinamide) nucleotide adenylyltransferase [Flavobacteriales bacterium]
MGELEKNTKILHDFVKGKIRMKVGLFFGSFNPLHVGHMIIANHMLGAGLDKVWFVVSPHNPLKDKKSLLAANHRIYMCNVAIEDNPKFMVCDIETKLEQPSYTVNTLTHLREKYPQYDFALIMGEDNLAGFHKWKNPGEIVKHHEVYVYARESATGEPKNEYYKHPKVKLEQTPLINITSTQIREMIKKGKDVKYMVTEPVYRYLVEMSFYK